MHHVVQISKDGNKVKIVEHGNSDEDAFWVGRKSIEQLTDDEIDAYHEEDIPEYGDYSEESRP